MFTSHFKPPVFILRAYTGIVFVIAAGLVENVDVLFTFDSLALYSAGFINFMLFQLNP